MAAMALSAEDPSPGPMLVSNVQPPEMDFNESTMDTHQAPTRSENVSRQTSPSRTVLKSPPKNGVPPKRLSMTTRRPPPPTTGGSSRVNASVTTTSRGALGTGLSKPPTRPSISTAVRRPGTGVTAPTAASTGHKKRPSITSNEIQTVKRIDASASEENVKPTINKSEMRRNVHDKGEVKNVTQNFHTDKITSKADPSATSGRINNTSPMKLGLRSATNGSRPSSIHSTPRSQRPTASSSAGPAKVEPAKKRLSTIPASPAPPKPETTTTVTSMASPPAKETRPVLLNRKSTMSVTIEQRLREMELVHQMLRVAMAEDGDEDDEAKEEYGRKVDESLASLRIRLEEARRNEGMAPEGGDKGASTEQSGGVDTNEATSDPTELLESLRESEHKISALNIEISDLQQRLDQATLQASSTEELSSRNAALKDAQEHLQKEIQRLQEAHALQADELSRSHATELAAAQAERAEVETRFQEELARLTADQEKALTLAVSKCSNEAADKLESEIHAYTSRLQALELDLAAEKKKTVAAMSVSEELKREASSLHNLLAEERQKLADLERSSDERHADVMKENENMLLEKENNISRLERQLQELRTNQDRLEDAERVSSKRRNDLESELVAANDKLSYLEASHRSVVSSYEKKVYDKDHEIKGLAQVIEEFQDKVQDLHEQKERAVDETKLDLIEEHQKVVSDLQRRHRDETAELTLIHEQELHAVRAECDNNLESARVSYRDELKRMQELLDHAEDSKDSAELAIAEGKTVIEALRAQVASLEPSRDEIETSTSVSDDTFKRAFDEINGLRKHLETLGEDTEEKNRQQAAALKKVEEELARTTKALEEKRTESELVKQSHAEEIHGLKARHALEMKELQSDSQGALVELQGNYDKLLADIKKAEKEHDEELGILRSEHAETLQKHAEDLECLHKKHAQETQEKLDQVSSKYQEQIKAMDERHDQMCKSLQEQVDLAKEQLVQLKDSQDSAASERCEELGIQLEGLRSQLADSQREVNEGNNEIARLMIELQESRKALEDTTEIDQLRCEMYTLTQQHAAEIARLEEAAALENEKRAKERKQGAEVRDRLASEVERLRSDLVDAKAEVEKHLTELHASRAEIQEAVKQNAASSQAAQRHKGDFQKVADDLQAARAEVEKLKRARSQARKEHSSGINQQLEALQIAADSEREQNTKLREQIREAQATAERQATKLREVECALKVTTAELVEAQTIRPNSSEFSASPAPKSGLRSSRWAVTDVADATDNERMEEDEDLGPSIEGNMAGIQEQIRQLGDMNHDVLEEEERFVKKLSGVGELRASGLESTSAPAASDIQEEENEVL